MNGAFAAIAVPPGRDGVREHVVVDLVASPGTVFGARPDDPLGGKLPQHICGLLLFDLGVAGEIARPVRDLGSRKA